MGRPVKLNNSYMINAKYRPWKRTIPARMSSIRGPIIHPSRVALSSLIDMYYPKIIQTLTMTVHPLELYHDTERSEIDILRALYRSTCRTPSELGKMIYVTTTLPDVTKNIDLDRSAGSAYKFTLHRLHNYTAFMKTL